MKPTILDQIVEEKHLEVKCRMAKIPLGLLAEKAQERRERRSFLRVLQQPGVRVIAEIKRASPSKGVLDAKLDPVAVALQYEAGGAAALSVLTESHFFLGSDSDLLEARQATALPVLRKDFILHDYQVYETAAMGADAILLIARILDDSTLRRLYAVAQQLNLDVLAEVNNRDDLRRVQEIGAVIIGINNRNLATFETNLSTAIDLAKEAQQSNALSVALSGISSPKDVQLNLRAGIRHFLIGEALVKSGDPAARLRELRALSPMSEEL